MNEARRTTILDLICEIEKHKKGLAEIIASLDKVLDEEDNARANIPDNFSSSEKYLSSEEASDNIIDANNNLSDAKDLLQKAVDLLEII